MGVEGVERGGGVRSPSSYPLKPFAPKISIMVHDHEQKCRAEIICLLSSRPQNEYASIHKRNECKKTKNKKTSWSAVFKTTE